MFYAYRERMANEYSQWAESLEEVNCTLYYLYILCVCVWLCDNDILKLSQYDNTPQQYIRHRNVFPVDHFYRILSNVNTSGIDVTFVWSLRAFK